MARKSGLDRRAFLKASGAAALGAAALTANSEAKAERNVVDDGKRAEGPKPGAEPIDLVNVLQGNESTRVFSRGNTLPIAAAPFGMAHWTLQSEDDTAFMFQPSHRRLQGLRCTHQLSPWLSDYGQAIFLPFSGDPDPKPEPRASSWRPEDAHLHPYSFRLRLARYQADVELVPSERCAVMTAQFANNQPSGFLVEVPDSADAIETEGKRVLRFKSRTNRGGVPENFANYYVVRFAEPWESFETRTEGESQIAMARFGNARTGNTQRIEARIATSFISFEQAERNLDRELGTKSVDELRAAAKASWKEHFGRIEVDGGSDRELKTFYSCLYRTLLFPRIFHEPDADGKPQHFSAYTGKVVPGVMYADHGYWDVYRAWYPFMALVYPERLGEILQAWTNAYKEGGWLPQFPAPGYRACMTGSLIDAVFGDAAAKGIHISSANGQGGFDLATAYEGLKHATQPGDPDKGYGRRGIEDYLKLGYVSADHVKQSAAETSDSAYGDFCIAQVAKALGREDDAKMFLKRSQNWRHLFDPKTGFLRGKQLNGAFIEPFDPIQWGSPYVEGSAWQHRWDVPQDLPALFEAMGGKERAVAALDTMLTMPPDFHVGIYGYEIHEMSEMAAVNFGQYAQSNQPVHHVLYIYALAGRPDRTQYWVRKTMKDLYSPEAFPGDEDTGSMAAWYVLGALGFYPVCPGKAEYVAGSPLFDRATLHLPGGKTTVIEARNQSPEAMYVGTLLVNGKLRTEPVIEHKEIAGGGRLTFAMQTEPAVRV